MLVLWRRHIQNCSHAHQGRKYLKCRCPVWIDWRLSGRRVRKPLNLRDWQAAQIKARQLEAEGDITELIPLTLEQAGKKFLADAKARELRDSSIYKYKLLLKQLDAFAQARGYIFLASLGVDELRAFRASWFNKNLSARKKLEHLKSFFNFCYDSGWVKRNPAKPIKPPKVKEPQVLPFSDAEMKKILKACDSHPISARATQLRALVLLMRHSGLRIGDACTLKRERIRRGVLELYTAKSGTKVQIPLNPVVIQALGKIPKTNEFYFWSGTSKRETGVKVWENTFSKMFTRAGIDGHSHQLRHTFAASLLQKSVSMENVSTLLGHRNIKITQKYYASWVPGRQKQLEQEVRKTW